MSCAVFTTGSHRRSVLTSGCWSSSEQIGNGCVSFPGEAFFFLNLSKPWTSLHHRMAGRSYTQLQKTREAISYKLSIRELGRVCLLLAAGQMQEGIVLVEVAPWGKVDFTLWWLLREKGLLWEEDLEKNNESRQLIIGRLSGCVLLISRILLGKTFSSMKPSCLYLMVADFFLVVY